MIKNSLPRQSVGVSELLSLLPEDLLDRLSEKFKADKWVQKLRSDVIFKLVLYSVLHSERISLRLMALYYSQPQFQAFAQVAGQTAHNSIRDRLRTVPLGYFASLYDGFYQQAAALYGESEMEHKYHLRRYDSTLIATYAHLLDGMRVGNSARNKVQAKFSFEFKDDFLLRAQFFSLQKYLSEETALAQVVSQSDLQANEVAVFDRGLKSRAFFQQCQEQHKLFITRAKEDLRYVLLKEHHVPAPDPNEPLTVQLDAQVQLFASGYKVQQITLRLIRVLDPKGKILIFITNIPPHELTALQVAALYRKRWDIEVLFRFLKQEMNLKHLVCNDPNAIAVVLYCTLIAASMILIFKKKNNIKSFKTAKILFVNELINDIIYEALQSEDGILLLKKITKPPNRNQT